MTTTPRTGRYLAVFRALDAAAVRYVVVGGLAVVLHGHPRMTVDLDVVVDLAPEPAARAMEVLSSLGLLPRLPVPAAAFADPDVRGHWVRERNLQVFSLYDPADPFREVDVFATEPLPFEELFDASEVLTVDSTSVRVASLGHLVAMKRAVGRPQDVEDVRALERLQEPGGE